MISYPPALRRTGFIAPKAIGRFGLAVMEARSAKTGRVLQPAEPSPAPLSLVPPAAPHRRTVVRLWIPATLIFLLLAPFALLLAPLLYLAPRRVVARPFATVIGLGVVLLSLGGTDIDIDTPDALVRLKIF